MAELPETKHKNLATYGTFLRAQAELRDTSFERLISLEDLK